VKSREDNNEHGMLKAISLRNVMSSPYPRVRIREQLRIALQLLSVRCEYLYSLCRKRPGSDSVLGGGGDFPKIRHNSIILL
jgi:hypothetical protein